MVPEKHLPKPHCDVSNLSGGLHCPAVATHELEWGTAEEWRNSRNGHWGGLKAKVCALHVRVWVFQLLNGRAEAVVVRKL